MGNLKFHIDDTCVKCGACAVDCPVQCITKGETQFNIGKGCIGCGDCYSICPVGAVKMSKCEPHKAQPGERLESFEMLELLTGYLIVLSLVQSKTKIRTLKSFL